MNSLSATLISLSLGVVFYPEFVLFGQPASATDAELPSDYCTELERMGSWVYNERRSAGGLAVVVCEEERRSRSRSRMLSMDMVEPVVCPKPRRLGVLNPSIKRYALNQEVEIGDAKAGRELLDMIVTKGSYGGDRSINHVASSPPAFYCGSPPSRASNPVIQDAQFGSEKITPLSISPAPPSPSSRCTRMKFGHKPAAVRVEGFDCLSRDQRNCSSISAVA